MNRVATDFAHFSINFLILLLNVTILFFVWLKLYTFIPQPVACSAYPESHAIKNHSNAPQWRPCITTRPAEKALKIGLTTT